MRIEEIESDIMGKLPVAVKSMQEYAKQTFENSLDWWYDDYKPDMYHRVNALYNSTTESAISSGGSYCEGSVYYNGNYSYMSGSHPTGNDVLKAADKGLHGASGLHTERGDSGYRLFYEAKKDMDMNFDICSEEALLDAGIPFIKG